MSKQIRIKTKTEHLGIFRVKMMSMKNKEKIWKAAGGGRQFVHGEQ